MSRRTLWTLKRRPRVSQSHVGKPRRISINRPHTRVHAGRHVGHCLLDVLMSEWRTYSEEWYRVGLANGRIRLNHRLSRPGTRQCGVVCGTRWLDVSVRQWTLDGTERERERARHADTEAASQTDRQREREHAWERVRERQSETEREPEQATDRQTDRQT